MEWKQGGALSYKKDVPIPANYYMIPLSPDAAWHCSTCGGLKHWSEYPVIDLQVNKRGTQCSLCKKIYQMNYAQTPHGIATKMWAGMNQRAGNKYQRYKTYADVKIEWSKDEWLSWSVPKIEAFLKDNPGERPSIDRIDNRGNYSPSNCQIISWTEHRRLKKLVRWERYVAYLKDNPAKLNAFVARHAHKITGETDTSKIISAISTLLGRTLDPAENSTLLMAIAHPELLLHLMYVIDNGR